MFEQKSLCGELLAETVNSLFADRLQLQTMASAARRQGKNDAAETILDICRELIATKRAA
jgi:UDP-N-acetylglucosamine:LPS N-acetylglucosamine transferase